MSVLRLMFLSYLLLNFDKVLIRLLFLLVYSYFVSIFLVMYHDGISSIIIFKKPLDLYSRIYDIIKWYYYNRGAVTVGLSLRIVPIMICTYFAQSYVWNIQWKTFFSNRMSYFFYKIRSLYTKNNRNNLPSDVLGLKKDCMEKVSGYIDELVASVLDINDSLTSDDVARIKKVCSVKVGFVIEDLIVSIASKKNKNKK